LDAEDLWRQETAKRDERIYYLQSASYCVTIAEYVKNQIENAAYAAE
jgi:hypothetical protein